VQDLHGCEAAYQIAKQNIEVCLYEMKPKKFSPAHTNPNLAEIVCSNSFKSNLLTNACGLLKEELRILGSELIKVADSVSVPAGQALAVDRERFSNKVTEIINSNKNIQVIREELTNIPKEGIVIIATGPLTSEKLSMEIIKLVDSQDLHFYDAAAPIIDKSTIDFNIAFYGDRYGKQGDNSYINLPMNKEEYTAFYDALITAEEAQLHDFEKGEKLKVFEGCMPVEVMARRGEDTLRFGPMKPVGISRPGTDEKYYAVVQLRKENREGTMYNLVGFQTHLTFPEQRRVFRMIPGLENAVFMRYGVMHRNTFLQSHMLLHADYSMRARDNLFFAGQMTGVEGYVE